MRQVLKILQVAFTYIGTVVGAGFASGQEILQFFTRFGTIGFLTIGLASFLFVWLGTKLMLLSHERRSISYEDMNTHLFGSWAGKLVSFFTLIALFCVTSVMLAGAGSVFMEYLGFPYQFGLLFTLLLAYFVLMGGMKAIMAVNSLIVPLMMFFTFVVVFLTMRLPGTGTWSFIVEDTDTMRLWLSPLLYTAFNLASAQAVLVPLGGEIRERSVVLWGGIAGGIGVGAMLFAGHYVLSAQMPEIAQFEIPMGILVHPFGRGLQILFLLLIFCEIFTTFIGDIYGLSKQLGEHLNLNPQVITMLLLTSCYLVSLIGFSMLLSTLYPIFGAVSLIWLVMLVSRRKSTI